VVNPYLLSREVLGKIEVPLESKRVEIIHQNLDWSQFRWGHDSVVILGKEYKLAKMFWVPRSQSEDQENNNTTTTTTTTQTTINNKTTTSLQT